MKGKLLQRTIAFAVLTAVIVLPGCSSATPTAAEPTPAPTATEPTLTTAEEVPRITVEDLKARLDAGENVVVVDARSRESFDSGHIAGAVSIPVSEVSERYTELPRAAEIVLYCT